MAAAFAFWLGRLDTQVVTGQLPAGVGTRDIRFCSVGDTLRRFLGRQPNSRGRWNIVLAPYPEAKLPAWRLCIAEYRFRGRECGLPGQAPSSKRPNPSYPLWRNVVTVLPRGGKPVHCILLLRDNQGSFHARVLHWNQTRNLPEPLSTSLRQRDECGRLIDQGMSAVEFLHMPVKGANSSEPPFASVPQAETKREWLARVSRLGRPASRRETRAVRRSRSRQLAEELKRRYGYRCQLCGDAARTIDMGAGRLYVEIHHILGLAEAEDPVGDDQEEGIFSLDSYRNVVVVCAYHHRLLHHYKSRFRYDHHRKRFVAEGGSLILPLTRNEHL